jgi:hypothetical protein
VGVSEGTTAPRVAGATATNPTAQESNVSIEFALSTVDGLTRLQQDGEGHLDIGRYSMAIIPQFRAKYEGLTRDAGFKTLASESRNLALMQPSLVFRGGKEPKSNETIGFFVEVTPVRSTDRGIEYKVSVKRSLPEISPTNEMHVASQNFDETVTLPPHSGLAIAGLLPRKPLVEGEEELYKANILKALLDPAFQRGDEEFVILINPRFHPPQTP